MNDYTAKTARPRKSENLNDYQSLPPKRSRTVQAAFTFKPRSGPRRIGDILKPLVKRIIIAAYCNGYLSKRRAQSFLRAIGGR